MDDNPGSPIAMLVTIGGAVSPVVYTLNKKQPPYLVFFVSKESKSKVIDDILPKLQYKPADYDFIYTPSPQDLLACYCELQEKLPELLLRWALSPGRLAVDYTAGTKPMSVAAVLASIESSSQYFYVGSIGPEGRDREGMGVVLDGREYTWFDENPWDALAVVERKDIAMLFNLGRFREAKERTLHLAEVVEPEMQNVYRAVAEMIEGYELWERFDYRRANVLLNKALKALQFFIAGRQDPLRYCLAVVSDNLSFLAKLIQKNKDLDTAREYHHMDVLDLIANAARRAQLECKYDDAAARLYSALECLARYRLLDEYGIKNNDVRREQLQTRLTKDVVERYITGEREGESIRLGLQASYCLLAHLDDELGKRYLAREKEIEKVLYVRNQSRLAHGSLPVDEDTYLRMREIVFDFAQVSDEALPRFPQLVL